MNTRIDELDKLKTEVLKNFKEPQRSLCEASFDRLVALNKGLIEIGELSFGYTPVEVTGINLKFEYDIKKEISEVMDNIKQIFRASNLNTGILRSLDSHNLQEIIKQNQTQEKQLNESPKANLTSISSTALIIAKGLFSKVKRAISPSEPQHSTGTKSKKTKGRTTPISEGRNPLDKNVAQAQEEIQKSPRHHGKG